MAAGRAEPQAPAEAAVVADGRLLWQHQVEEVEAAHLALVDPPRVLVDRFGQAGQAELAGRIADAGGDQLAQDASLVPGRVVKGRVRPAGQNVVTDDEDLPFDMALAGRPVGGQDVDIEVEMAGETDRFRMQRDPSSPQST